MPDLEMIPAGRRFLGAAGLFVLTILASGGAAAATEARSWSEAELVGAYSELHGSGALDAAIRSPARPHEPPQAAFLQALAWFAAGTPEQAGQIDLQVLDRFLDGQVALYAELLRSHVEDGAANDYARTRSWKVVQKLMLLRDEMSRSPNEGRYAFPAMPLASAEDDPWERQHTLDSPEAFAEKVCNGPRGRPVLVKFGNTNCTQCMLFELTGSVKDYAERAAEQTSLEVYKVWWGLRPDDSFAGRLRDPARLNELAQAEGVRSSPTFIVYRDGRRYPCGDAFPDAAGAEPHLDRCLADSKGEAPLASVCEGKGKAR